MAVLGKQPARHADGGPLLGEVRSGGFWGVGFLAVASGAWLCRGANDGGWKLLRKWLVSLFAVVVLAIVPMAGTAEASYFPWGQCTYWAALMRPDIGSSVSGNAWYWSTAAANAGFLVNSAPALGAVVVFQPGVQGSWGAGHVAYVTSVGNNGWFQVSEMDYPYFGRVTYRWAHTGWGVRFIH